MERLAGNLLDSYWFNIVGDPSTANYTFIHSIGHEYHFQGDEVRYYWDCRLADYNAASATCIFQYTVSGEGNLEVGDHVYRQKAGDFFLIERPGPFRYWIPKDSDHWEIKFVDFTSPSLLAWNGIVQSFGRVFKAERDNPIISLWDEIFQKVKNHQIDSVFENAKSAYAFLLTFHQYLAQSGLKSKKAEVIQQCVRYIENHFSEPITLEDIAQAGNLSPFSVNKAFKVVIGTTPILYLTKERVRRSMKYLLETSLTVEEISQLCGFQNGNYFAKVFRKYVNTSPTDFRKQKMTPIIL